MRAFVLALLLPLGSALAQAPADAPQASLEGLVVKQALVETVGGDRVQVVEGCWLSTARCVGSAQRLVAAEARAASLQASLQTSFSREELVLAVGAGVLLGIVLGVGGKALVAKVSTSAAAEGTHTR